MPPYRALSLGLCALASAIAVGFVGVEFLLRGPLYSPPDVMLTLRAQPAGSDQLLDSERTTSSLLKARPELGPPHESSPDWLPQMKVVRPFLGVSTGSEPYSIEWRAQALFLPESPELQDQAERAFRASMFRDYIESLESMLPRVRELASGPWKSAQFQVIGTLGLPRNVTLVGRDFLPPASPATSLRWYEVTNGRKLDSDRRSRALTALCGLERTRKQAFSKMADRAVALERGEQEDVVAYAIIGGHFFAFAKGDVSALDEFVTHLRSTDDAVFAQVATILKE